MAAITFNLNGKLQTVDVAKEMPLLWVLRDTLGMTGTKFGCGVAQCGACTVHVNGSPTRSCITQVAGVAGQERNDHRGIVAERLASGAGCVDRGGCAAVRILPIRTDHDGGGTGGEE